MGILIARYNGLMIKEKGPKDSFFSMFKTGNLQKSSALYMKSCWECAVAASILVEVSVSAMYHEYFRWS